MGVEAPLKSTVAGSATTGVPSAGVKVYVVAGFGSTLSVTG